MGTAIQVKIFQKLHDIEALRADWDNLHSTFAENNPFLSWTWIYNWYKYVGINKGKIFCLGFYIDEELMGLAPLFIKKRRTPFFNKSMEFASQEASCYLGILCNRVHNAIIWQRLFEFLISTKTAYDRLFLDGVELQKRIFQGVDKRSFYYKRRHEKDSWRISLPDNFKKYAEELESKFSKKIFYYMRRLKKMDGFKFKIAQESDFEISWHEFVKLHRENINKKNEETYFSDGSFCSFAKEAARGFLKNNTLKLCKLSLNNKTAAVLWGLETNDDFFYINIGLDARYEKFSIGITMPAFCIEYAIENRKKHFDFLSGRDRYKQKMGAEKIAQYSILRYANPVAALQDNFLNLINR